MRLRQYGCRFKKFSEDEVILVVGVRIDRRRNDDSGLVFMESSFISLGVYNLGVGLSSTFILSSSEDIKDSFVGEFLLMMFTVAPDAFGFIDPACVNEEFD